MRKIIMGVLLFIICGLFLSGGYEKEDIFEVPDETCTERGVRWEWLINPGEYQDVMILDENFIGVKNESGQYGFINSNKELVADFQYFNIIDENENIVTVIDADNKWTFIDFKGKKISRESYDEAHSFREGRAAVKKENQWGFIDAEGNLVLACQFDNVKTGYHDKFAAVEKDGQWFFIDYEGNNVFQKYFEDVNDFHEGYAGVKSGGKWGFINSEGQWIIEPEYNEVGNFSEGLAAVKSCMNGVEQWAYINAQNKVIIGYSIYDTCEGRLATAGEFKNGYALVSKTLYCLMDKSGNIVLGDDSYLLTLGSDYGNAKGWIVAYQYKDSEMKNRAYGLIDIEGNVVLPLVFDYVLGMKGELTAVMHNQKTGILRCRDI